MVSNSKPLRWDTPAPAGLWAMEIGLRWTEAEARAKLLDDIGEVDERFVHIIPDVNDRPSIRYLYVSRAETDGFSAV